MDVRLCFMPCSLSESDLKDRVAVVIDVLRASTSICTALAHGCREVIPVASPEEATSMRANLDRGVLLCGERQGKKVEGFDLGNSPAEYTEDAVHDRTLLFASTNGSGTMVRCRGSHTILVGGFVNLSAVAAALPAYDRDVTIVCSGREGGFSLEDSLCGGMLVDRLVGSGDFEVGDDSALVGRLVYKEYADSLQQAVRGSEHGRYLESLGFLADIQVAAALDTISVVPVWDEGKLVSAS